MGKKGKLVFKGDKPKKKSKKSKIAKREREETTTTTTTTTAAATTIDAPRRDDSRSPTATASDAARRKVSSASATPTIQNGTGRITSSGTVVSGHGTTFEKEISVGDAILVILPNQKNNTEEMRIVTMRLSNTSLNLSSAFSHNLSEPRKFRFVRKPRNAEQERKKERQRQMEEANETEKSAFDIYGTAARGANVFTYREKTETGSYRVKQQQLSSSQSTRGDLLALRSKKTSDKYC